ncbi:AAEL002746-PA [Aedes aegypti]|uniref:AAEL002746-PA n=1 Tax=Aedes aegypti TaxID=7159 RepID=Q17HB6_AEDAE|nr:AAEL002746-PA [Aedes aegypti]
MLECMGKRVNEVMLVNDSPGNPTAPAPPPAIIGSPDQQQQKISTVALHSTEALMAGFLKSTDLGPHGPHGYGSSHHPHHAHPHGPLPPGMPMTSLAPFGLPHGLDAVGFPQDFYWDSCEILIGIPASEGGL